MKYTLNERYILLEKTTADHINDLNQFLKKLKPIIEKFLTDVKNKDNTAKIEQNNLKQLIGSPTAQADPSKMEEYKKSLINIFDNLLPQWRASYPKIVEFLESENGNQPENNVLKSILQNILNIFTGFEQTLFYIQTLYDAVTKRLSWVTDVLKDLQGSGKYTKQETYRSELTKYAGSIPQITSIVQKNLTQDILVNKVDNIAQECNKIRELLGFEAVTFTANQPAPENTPTDEPENIKDEVPTDETQNSTNTTSKEIDWQERYSNYIENTASDTNFWNEYFKAMFGNFVNKAVALGDQFVKDIKTLGFNPTENALVFFIKNNVTVDNGLNIDQDHYKYLHNACSNKYVSDRNLRYTTANTTLSAAINFQNLIYCNDLYKQSEGNMMYLLRLQSSVIDVAKDRIEALAEGERKQKYEKVGAAGLLVDIFYDGYSIDSNVTNYPESMAQIRQAKIKGMVDIKKAAAAFNITVKSTNEKVAFSADNKFFNSFNPANINNARAVVQYILSFSDYITKTAVDKWKNAFNISDDSQLSLNNATKIKSSIHKSKLDIDKDYEQVIQEIYNRVTKAE